MTKATSFPDARALLAFVLVVTSVAIAVNDLAVLAFLLVFILGALRMASVPLVKLCRRLWRYRWLWLGLALVQSMTGVGGKTLLSWGNYVLLSSAGLAAALAALLRIGVILAAALLLSIKDYQQLATALAQMKVPYELAFMILLAARFLPILMEEFRDSLIAMQLRGIELKAVPFRKRLGLYTYILLPTTGAALVRARRIAIAMEARGFRAYRRRTWLDWPRLTLPDWLTIVFTIIGASAVLWLKFSGLIA